MSTSRKRYACVLAAGTMAATLGLAGCSGDSQGSVSSAVPPFPTPMATSVQLSNGTWATVAMGHLGDPLNTFWQLFLQPGSRGSWSNQVEATATATNGGLVLAGAGSDQLVVGIRPSNFLHYTPIITTASGGARWSNGLLDAQLVSRPDALAVSSSGAALAIDTNRFGTNQVVSGPGLSSWRPLVSETALATVPSGRACGPTEFTAVGFIGSRGFVGTACSRPGLPGIFTHDGSSWQRVGPRLPRSAAGDRAEVLALAPTTSGMAAVLGLSGAFGPGLAAAWTADGTSWQCSTVLRPPRGTISSPTGRRAEVGSLSCSGEGARGGCTRSTLRADAGARHRPRPR